MVRVLFTILSTVAITVGPIEAASYAEAPTNQHVETQAITSSFDPAELATTNSWISASMDENLLMTVEEEELKDLTSEFDYVLNGAQLNVVSLPKEEAIEFLSSHPEVKLETDRVIETNATQSNVDWGLDRLDQTTPSLDGKYSYNSSGLGVTIYVVDSGVMSNHDELRGRVLSGAYLPSVGSSPEDCDGHGTHVAAIAAGKNYGVAKEAKIYPIRVLDCYGRGRLSSVISAMEWIVDNHAGGPGVINMSVGDFYSSSVNAAVEYAASYGFIPVSAAGNDAFDACYMSPASSIGTITVGAVGTGDKFAYFSNYGGCVDILAPGVDIRSASIAYQSASVVMSGTSMASPFVAGAVARVLQINPSLNLDQVRDWIGTSSIKGAVRGIPDSYTPNRLLHLDYSGFLFSSNPTIEGVPKVGEVLTASPGIWDNGTSFMWQWFRNGVAVNGEQGNSYLLTAADAGTSIQVHLNGTRGNVNKTLASSPTAQVALGNFEDIPSFAISGEVKVGKTLSIPMSGLPAGSVTNNVRWFANGSLLVDSQTRDLLVLPEHLGKRLTAEFDVSAPGYESFRVATEETAPVIEGEFSPAPIPNVIGSASKGATVSAGLGNWPVGTKLTHYWTLDGEQIGEANQATLLLDEVMVGKVLNLVVKGELAGYLDLEVSLPSPITILATSTPSYWAKRLATPEGQTLNQAKLYAKNIIGAGKVEFRVNSQSIAWVKAIDESNPKLRFAAGANYLVRTVELRDGKNTLEVYVNGKRVKRVVYSR